jgi:cobalt/nickel transport protein
MFRHLMALSMLLAASPAWAHFQELIPNADILAEDGDRTVHLDLTFTHPMERGPVMEMAAPIQFGVLAGGVKQDLRKALKAVRKGEGKTAYEASHKIAAPGDSVFYLEPAPYWEPAEGKMIIHYTKVVVDFASGTGWDKLVGLPVEIEPLVRPYGLWTGNAFRGIVRKGGKPVPFAEIEVEWRNDGSVKAPSDPFITQVVKADASGQFSYVMPRAGWWGFAALVDGDKPLKGPDGKPVPVELGGLMWVKTQDMK